MKRTSVYLGWLGLGLALTAPGCWQKSVHPFYRASDVQFEPALLGRWLEPDSKPEENKPWTFTRNGDRAYRLKFFMDDKEFEYDVHYFQLGTGRYLDLFARTRGLSEVPAHHLFRVLGVGAELELQNLSAEWVAKWVSAHPQSISHVRVPGTAPDGNAEEEEVVLTASTKELQKFIRKYGERDGFFDKPARLAKLP